MKNNDYGHYGKGTSGYVHYTQGMNESKNSQYTGGSNQIDPLIIKVAIAIGIFCFIAALM